MEKKRKKTAPAPQPDPPPVALNDPSLYINRELSLLAFQWRVHVMAISGERSSQASPMPVRTECSRARN